ncbi:PREDICTED: homeobox-leucine zipper protein HOX11-like [Erythranthe guttata]|uniref:homeobox-leucine zipper protein HOX11-like n=1 Tax=Erythranthe guttata TaxID=4155 RepID=UPI00064E06AF|nr:PREDICTED: homeobox-leucine zipper protein HOX11-like [Erythranthe guttata]|eukprot:XP_012831337.1 PREDICTED: homeobox-leucine zipper protein HOX11-like [Erythranthe guttata]
MELGLSLGFLDKNIQNQNQKKKINNGGLDFCIALGLNSVAVGNDRETEIRQTQQSHENDDEDGGDGGGGGGGGGCEISDDGDGSDDNTPGEAHLQLNLAPVVPRRRLSSHIQSFPWSSDNVFGPSEGSSENGGSSGNIGAAAAWGLDVNRLPEAAASAAEDVSSENTAGSPFNLGFGVYRNTENPPSGAAGKRDFDAAAVGNDGSAGSSRASDDDENGVNARKKLRLSKEQSAYLEESFKEHNTLNPKQKQALAKQLNLRPRQVEVWFQNRRARTKLKQTEVDCEYLKRCCETLTVENRRLHKEVQELRALKTTSNNPFYTQLPATTLTMCPSCERVATTTAAAAAVSPPTANNNNNSITKAIGFPVSRPRFYPFSQTPTHHHNSKSSV